MTGDREAKLWADMADKTPPLLFLVGRLHTFLHDLLSDYFVWPRVVHIPLWDENAPVAPISPAATTTGPVAK